MKIYDKFYDKYGNYTRKVSKNVKENLIRKRIFFCLRSSWLDYVVNKIFIRFYLRFSKKKIYDSTWEDCKLCFLALIIFQKLKNKSREKKNVVNRIEIKIDKSGFEEKLRDRLQVDSGIHRFIHDNLLRFVAKGDLYVRVFQKFLALIDKNFF